MVTHSRVCLALLVGAILLGAGCEGTLLKGEAFKYETWEDKSWSYDAGGSDNGCGPGDTCPGAADTATTGCSDRSACDDHNPCTKDECQDGHCDHVVLPDDAVCDGGKVNLMTEVEESPFFMGCNAALDQLCQDDEKPQHEVMISTFRISTLETMVAQYERCVQVGACGFPARSYAQDQRCNWESGRLTHPINCVSWQQAQAYCNWIGGRQPTEAEWEKAARGGCDKHESDNCPAAMLTWPWGEVAPACDKAVLEGCTQNTTSEAFTATDGSSPYVVMGMAGNVAEWVQDFYGGTYYGTSPSANPPGPATGAAHVVRGGSAWEGVNAARSGNRSIVDDKGFNDFPYVIGFRCVLPGAK